MIASILLFCILVYAIRKFSFFKLSGISSNLLLIFFIVKIASSVGTWAYFYFKPGFGNEADLYQFYKIALQLHTKLPWFEQFNVSFGLPVSHETKNILFNTDYWHKLHDYGLMNDNRLMIRFNLFISWFSDKSFLFHSLCFSFIGFTGMILLLKSIISFNVPHLRTISFFLFLTPSAQIWNGSMFKETIQLFTLGLVCYFSIRYLRDKNAKNVLFLLLGVFLMVQTKPNFSLLFIYSFLCFLLFNYLKLLTNRLSFVGLFFIPLFLLIVADIFFYTNTKTTDDARRGTNFHFPTLLKSKQEDFLFDVKVFQPATSVRLNRIDDTYLSILKTVPDALKNTLIKPFEFVVKKWELIPFVIELLLLSGLIVLRIIYPAKISDELKTFLHTLLFPSILSLLLIGLVTPIVGLIVKYNAVIWPLIILFFTLRIDWTRISFEKMKRLLRYNHV